MYAQVYIILNWNFVFSGDLVLRNANQICQKFI